MSSFYGLEIAKKSLLLNQKAIEVTGHNLSNANTEGYSRQVLRIEAVVPSAGNQLSGVGVSNIGAGARITDITSVRNEFYDAMYRKENASLGELSAKTTAYTYIEDVLGEGAAGGILSSLGSVFDDLDQLSQNAESDLYREQLRQDVVTLTSNLGITATHLYEYQQEQDENVQRITGQVNQLAGQIADLNDTIFKYELSGNRANDLRDQRGLLVDELSGLTSVAVSETADGQFSVSVGGIALVNHIAVHEIELKADTVNPVTGSVYVTPYWKDTNIKVSPGGGALKAALDIRDGSDAGSPGIPYFLSELDNLAGSLVQEFNTINQAGYTLPYGANVSQTGVDFFDPAKVHAYDITLSDAILENNANIAASSAAVDGYENWSNAENLGSFLALRDSTNIVYGGVALGNYESYMRGVTTEVAIITNYTAGKDETQQAMVDYVGEQRMSISGVSLDEETVNLVRYQQSYQAAAKMITAIDEMLNTLINM